MSDPSNRRDAGSSGGRDARPHLDSDLRDSFAALRRQEETTAPGVATLSERAARRRQRGSLHRRFRPLAMAATGAAVAAALVVGSSGWLRTHAPQPGPSGGHVSSITSISGWRPETDFLLRTPGQEVLTQPPSFGSSSIDIELGLGGAAANRRDVQRRP